MNSFFYIVEVSINLTPGAGKLILNLSHSLHVIFLFDVGAEKDKTAL